MHQQQHDAERESWMNLIDWHFSFCCCFSFAEFIHDQSAAVARHTYCEFDRTESKFCFFPSHNTLPVRPLCRKRACDIISPPTTIRRCLQNNRTISSKRISQTLKIFIPMKLFSKEFRSTWRWRLMCHTFHLLQFLFCGFFPSLRRLMISSLFTPQLIGFQEVQRPTSRTEIVQAMRRIRVS